MTEANKKDNDLTLVRVLHIHYSPRFQKSNKNKGRALINSGNKINAMTLAYELKLGLQVCQTNVKAQKINVSTLKMFRIVPTSF